MQWSTGLLTTLICLSTLFAGYLNGDTHFDNSKLICEGENLPLHCTKGKVIQIVRAYYGRYSVTKCNDNHNTDITIKCAADNACEIIKDK